MGQQQLLLIILGIIIIGIAITVGISLFNANATESKRNNIINDLVHLASEAQKHYKTPRAMGGGQNTFTGWDIPRKLRTNANGNYGAVVSPNNVLLMGTGNGDVTSNNFVQVQMTVTQNDYVTQIIR